MADSSVSITPGSGNSIDTRTEDTNSNHRQVVVIGGPSVNAAVAEVASVDPGPTSTSYGTVVRLAGSAQVQIAGSSGSLNVYIGGTAGTIAANIGKVDGTVAVFFSPSSPQIGGITSSINVYLGGTAGTIAVNVGRVQETVSIYLGSTAGTIAVNVGKVDGTAAVFFSPANPAVNVGTPSVNDLSATATIPQTVSGTASTAGGSGSNTLKAPVTSRNIKVYAYSLSTTGIVSISPRFTTGGSAGATELWRVALQSPSGVGSGANLAVVPPGYLFSTGIGNTLALYLDSATLVHYSVAYFLESA